MQPADGGGSLYADLNGSNALQTRYLRGDALDQLFARITGGTGGTAAWYLADREGSVQNLTDDSGNLQDTITYDAFGNVLSESNASYGDRYKYTGSQLDSETGLQYDRARVYDSVHGRWLSQDPLGFSAGDTNLYRYVGNDPTGATDPSGLQRLLDPTGSVQPVSDPWLPPNTPPSFGDITPGTPEAIAPLPGVGQPGPEAGGLGSALQSQNVTADYRSVYGLGPLGNWINLTPEAPAETGPATWDPNEQPVMQALSDTSTPFSNQNVTADYRSVWGRGPLGNWVNLTPEPPNWAGPATWDPNAPQPVMQALSDNSGSYPNVDSSDGVAQHVVGPWSGWPMAEPDSGGAALGRAGYVRPERAPTGHAGAFRQFGVISKRGLVGRCCARCGALVRMANGRT